MPCCAVILTLESGDLFRGKDLGYDTAAVAVSAYRSGLKLQMETERLRDAGLKLQYEKEIGNTENSHVPKNEKDPGLGMGF